MCSWRVEGVWLLCEGGWYECEEMEERGEHRRDSRSNIPEPIKGSLTCEGTSPSFPPRPLMRGLFSRASALSLPRRATLLVPALTMALSAANAQPNVGGKLVRGNEDIMAQKAHGTTQTPVQTNLRWDVQRDTADKICSFNRHYAEYSGYFRNVPQFLDECKKGQEIVYYDSVTGKPLFVAPRGRTMEQFVAESASHGWPSFRDEEVVWENMRVLKDGEAVSVDGTHLGHNLPDFKGNRYCINLVSVAGNPVQSSS